MKNNITVQLYPAAWLALAATIPLFGVPILRWNLGIYHIPIPAIVLGFIFCLIAFRYSYFKVQTRNFKKYGWLFLLTGLFFLAHGMSIFYSDVLEYAVREIIKISSALTTFWVIIFFFPTDIKFLTTILKTIACSTLILVLALIYQYAIISKQAYLGTCFNPVSVMGKNHLAWILAVFFPYSLTFLFTNRFHKFWVVANIIIGVAIAYTMSRSSWIAVIMVFLYFVLFAFRGHTTLNLKMAICFLVGVALFFGGIIWKVNMLDELKIRVQSIYNADTLPESPETIRLGKYSKHTRLMLIETAFDRFKTHPFRGAGLGSFSHNPDDKWVTHNDYMSALGETGLLGFLPFLFSLALLAHMLFQGSWRQHLPMLARAAQASFLVILFLSNFINIYTSVHYWLFLAFCLKIKEISQAATPKW